MDWFKKKAGKIRKPKTNAHSTPLTPTPSSVPRLEANDSTPALSDVQHESQLVDISMEHPPVLVANAAVDEQPEQTSRRETMMRGSRTEKWLSRATLLLSLTKSAADAGGLAPLKGACEGVVTLLDAFQEIKDNRSAWSDLLRSVQAHATAFQKQLNQLGIEDVIEEVGDSISGPITEYLAALTELVADICAESGLKESEFNDRLTFKILAQRIGTTKIESNIIAGYETRLKETEQRIMFFMMTYVAVSVNASKDADVLKPLQFKHQRQRPDSCQPGTRTEILAACEAWANDDSAPNILWIKGVPGAGKSAVTSSLVGNLRINKDRLGSDFAFNRQDSNTSTTSAVWKNAAYDIARHPTVRKDLVEKLKKDQIDLRTPNIDELFRQLIIEPLSKIQGIPIEQSPIIIIDALDECGGLDGSRSKERQRLMATLVSWSKLPSNFKLIVSSREEDDIARTFRRYPPMTIDLLSGEATVEQSKRDIQAFLAQKLGGIAVEYSTLPVDWPGPQVIESLAMKANGLFIWASTVIQYIAAGPVTTLLEEVLRGEGMNDMDQLYTQVLLTAFPGLRDDVKQDARAILGAIVVAKGTLDVVTLSKLLSIESPKTEHICNRLRSVLENEGGIRFRHQSFVDFLLTSEESEYSLQISVCKQALVTRCLDVMKTGLRFNICDISSSAVLNDEILEAIPSLEEHIPTHLQYASRYWVAHLHNAPYNKGIATGVRYFLKFQLLSWLEIASFCRFVDEANGMLVSLVRWLKLNECDDLIPLAADMSRFIAHFRHIISQSVPHIYLSALPFAPRSSVMRKQYQDQYPNTLQVEMGGHQAWSPLLTTLRGHYNGRCTIAISSNGKKIAFGSSNAMVRIWDLEAGEQVGGALEGHRDLVNSVAFSPDDRRIVSGSNDRTVRIWDTDTGDQEGGSLEGHGDCVRSVAFSPDGRHIVSGSDDCTVRIWNADTGEQVGEPLKGHSEWVRAAAFSPDSQHIVSGSDDGTIRIWDANTGEQVGESLQGHNEVVGSAAFAPDGRQIVSGSDDCTIRIWDLDTGRQVGESLKGHTEYVNSVTFSPDGRRIVSGSSDHTVRIWDVDTSEQVGGSLEGHTEYVNSVIFSPDGRCIVSGSRDNTVRIWDANIDAQVGESLGGHTETVNSVTFSPDGRRIVSGSNDRTVCIWNTDTGDQVGEPLEGHSSWVRSAAFSPDGRQIVSGSDDHTIRIWDVDTGRQVGEPLEGHAGYVYSVAFSPNGRCIVSGSGDRTVRIWDAETREQVVESLEGHSSAVYSVAFSPDGLRIVSGSDDLTVRVWNFAHEVLTGPGLEQNQRVDDDGWLIGVGAEHLCWIPDLFRAGLERQRVLVIGRCPKTILNMTKFVHGKDWTSVKKGGKIPDDV